MLDNIKYYTCNKFFVALVISCVICYSYYYYLKNYSKNDFDDGRDDSENYFELEKFIKLFVGTYLCSLALIFGLYKFGYVDKYCPSFLSGGGNTVQINTQQTTKPEWLMETNFNTDLPTF